MCAARCLSITDRPRTVRPNRTERQSCYRHRLPATQLTVSPVQFLQEHRAAELLEAPAASHATNSLIRSKESISLGRREESRTTRKRNCWFALFLQYVPSLFHGKVTDGPATSRTYASKQKRVKRPKAVCAHTVALTAAIPSAYRHTGQEAQQQAWSSREGSSANRAAGNQLANCANELRNVTRTATPEQDRPVLHGCVARSGTGWDWRQDLSTTVGWGGFAQTVTESE
jgi:hypothetical protein